MYVTAVRRLIWARLGDLRKPPRPSAKMQECLKATYPGGLAFAAEGGAYGRYGWIVRTDAEVGFISQRRGQAFVRAYPFDALLETRIQRMFLYDYVHLVTKSERVSLRLFRSHRDMAQELFHQIQIVMSQRAATPAENPAGARPGVVPSSAEA